ncbi:MAG: RES family NAD+ phosphorylase [Steroidobacteraceae bacterium]
MRLYRLCKEAHSADVLLGQGGLIDWGRWHSKGRRIVYCATVEALAVLEVRVNLGNERAAVRYVMHTIELPDDGVSPIAAELLPTNWNAVPSKAASQKIGNAWLSSGRSLGLRVPSVHSRTDFNVLLNPACADYDRVQVLNRYRYPFDDRLFAMPDLGGH